MISISDPNLVLVEAMLSVLKTYPKVYYDAQQTYLFCIYFALEGKIAAGVILEYKIAAGVQNSCWGYPKPGPD